MRLASGEDGEDDSLLTTGRGLGGREKATEARGKPADINLSAAATAGGAEPAPAPAPAPAADKAIEDDLFSMISSKQAEDRAGGGDASVFDFNSYIANNQDGGGGLFD